jgi:iron(II)-dependent oxidoreductase
MKRHIIIMVLFISNAIYPQIPESDMVLIRAGEFMMGKNTREPTDWQPEHKVQLDEFYMDKYEVTNRQYYKFCKETNSPLPEFWESPQFKCSMEYPEHPVVGVNFTDAVRYAYWAGKRLPTEAEWEYAARGGLSGSDFPWGDQIDSTVCNYGRRYKSTLKVGSFKPNGYGLYDMSGNVWEWTSDNYGDDYYSDSPPQNPVGPSRGRFKVIRGGSWHSGAMCVQVYYRNGLPSNWIDFAVGFRCAKDVR